MTPGEHNRYVGLAHLGFGALNAIGVFVMVLMGVVLLSLEGETIEGEVPAWVLGYLMIVVAGLSVFVTIPSILAGYAFLKRRSWAKIAGIIAAVSISMSFPLGTAVAGYTFWFLFGEAGKQLYGILNAPAAPPPPPSDWSALRV